MPLSVLSILALGPFSELAPLVAGRVVFCVILLPVIPLLLAAAVTRSWRGALVIGAFCSAFLVGFNPLMNAGGYLNFLRHRDAYERILADAQAGRLPLDENGTFHGRRHGVAGHVNTRPTLSAGFDWGDPDGFFGVMFGPECAARPASRPAPETAPPPSGGDTTPTIKNAGLTGPQWPLGDRWCLTRVVY
jgi:hypothetical protein